MRTYKIGRCYYAEVPEEKQCDYPDEVSFALVDTDGEVIKYFRRVSSQKHIKKSEEKE